MQTNENKPQKQKKPRSFTLSVAGADHVLCCDGAPLKTPAGHPYAMPTAALAEAVLAEWARQKDDAFDVSQMPLSRLAATAIDIVAKKKEQIVEEMVVFATTDLLCHRADNPPALVERQQKIWNPLLTWAVQAYDAPLHVTSGIVPMTQPAMSLGALQKAILSYDPFWLTGLRQAVESMGSLVLGLALVNQVIEPRAAYHAAELDSLFQVESWGEDPVTRARLDAVEKDIEIAGVWFDLLRAA